MSNGAILSADGSIQGLPDFANPQKIEEYVSPEQDITLASLLTLQHNLSKKPQIVQLHLRCKVANHGYSVGDEIDITNVNRTHSSSANGYGFVIDLPNESDIEVQSGINGIQILITTSGAVSTLTITSWKIIVKAYAFTIGDVPEIVKVGTQYTDMVTLPSASEYDFAVPAEYQGIKYGEIDVILVGFSFSGGSNPILQLEGASGLVTTGYTGGARYIATTVVSENDTNGLNFIASPNAADFYYDVMKITLVDPDTFTYFTSGVSGEDSSNIVTYAGYLALGEPLTSVRLTTTGGSNTIDAGKMGLAFRRTGRI